ncbi:hypothetical protein BH10PSE16_BH10PSE16_25220 [soil metagenome]
MPQVIEFLRSVPDVIWSGLIASLLTLSGVLIANGSNTKRLRIQLQHDGAEKSRERTATLRREVYLCAVEELTKANSYLASLPQSDPTKANLADGFQDFFGAAAKLQLVAEPKTALLVNQLVATYGELLLRLMQRAIPLYKTRSDISINDDLYIKAQVQVTRILAEMAKFNEAAHVNDAVFAALQRSFEGYQAQTVKYAADRKVAWEKFNGLNVEFCRQLLTEMRTVGEQQIPVLVEIRRDLGLTTELTAFRQQMELQWIRMSAQFDALLHALQGD